MFWWSKDKTEHVDIIKIPVTTIPEDFYAGHTPDVTFLTSQLKKKSASKNNLTASEKKALDRATQVGAGGSKHPLTLLSSRKTFIWILGAVFVVFIIGASIYFFLISKKAPSTATIIVNTNTIVTPPATTTETPPPADTTSSATEPVTTKPATEPFATVAFDTSDSADSDGDGLTDLEEDLFKTDPNLADSDQDKYSDSHEVYNLYNPAGKEPQKLSDSGLVTNFTNPTVGYQLYTPISWAVGNVDPEYRDVLFSTFTGDYIRVHAYEKNANESFADFLARVLPAEKASDYVSFESRFKESGFRRSDYTVYIFFNDTTAMIMAYNLPPSNSVANYRTVIKMMARSFRHGISTVEIAPQVVESPTTTPAANVTPATPNSTSTQQAPSSTNL